MQQEQHFLDQIAENPNDEQVRLVYADYLEERQDPRAEYLKLEIAFHSAQSKSERDELRTQLRDKLALLIPGAGQTWILKVQRLAVEKCPSTKSGTTGIRLPFFGSKPKRQQESQREVEFLFKCDQSWLELEETTDQRIRFCSGCKELVYFSDTIEEANNHAMQNRCVAICTSQERSKGDLVDFDPSQMLMGLIVGSGDMEPDQFDEE